MAAVTTCSDFGAPKNEVSVSIVSPSIFHEVMGPYAMILAMLSWTWLRETGMWCKLMNQARSEITGHAEVRVGVLFKGIADPQL